MSYIEVIPYEDAEGRLKEIYEDLIKKRGKLASVHTIQSLNPESIVKHMDLYLEIMFGRSPLRRYQREMIAVIVSVANQCPYCMKHHGEALCFFWKDKEKVRQLTHDYHEAEINDADKLLCGYASELTLNPSQINENEHIQSLKKAGFEDRAILDAALVVAYFNFVNRLVLGLGVDIEEDGGEGYIYE